MTYGYYACKAVCYPYISLAERLIYPRQLLLHIDFCCSVSCIYTVLFKIPVSQYSLLLTGHTLPVKVIGFGTPLAIGELKVKLSSPISLVLYLPIGQLLGLPSFEVDDPRRQNTNPLSQ